MLVHCANSSDWQCPDKLLPSYSCHFRRWNSSTITDEEWHWILLSYFSCLSGSRNESARTQTTGKQTRRNVRHQWTTFCPYCKTLEIVEMTVDLPVSCPGMCSNKCLFPLQDEPSILIVRQKKKKNKNNPKPQSWTSKAATLYADVVKNGIGS